MSKRENYISWEEYFMGIAMLSAERSKDPTTQVGACIVKNKKILSVGYNGFPEGCSDDEFSWDSKDTNKEENKDLYVTHAELNAILNYKYNLSGATIYTTLFPCNECAKAIIQSGIKKVVYLKKKNSLKYDASARMFAAAGVAVEESQMDNLIVVNTKYKN